MNFPKNTAATLTLAGLLLAPTAFADSKPESSPMAGAIGFGSGALAGAVVGGPIGAVIGAAMGSLIGTDTIQQQQMAQVSGTLDESRQALAAAQDRLETVNRQLAHKNHEIQRAQQQHAALEDNHVQLKEWAEGLRLAVYFDHDSSAVKEHYQAMLNSISAPAGKLPGMRIMLEGRSNKSGPTDYNVQLSEKRALEVSETLVSQGLGSGQIVATPLGASNAPADRLYAPEQRRVDLMFRFEEQQNGLASNR